MVKYNFEFKLEVVTAYLAGKGGYKSLANQFSISDKSTVRKWVKVYETMGESGLKRRKSHKAYSVQFKLDVLQLIDTELLNQKLKKQSFIPVQLKEIHNQKKLILENDLESFFDLVKSFNQEHVFYKYGFYNQEDYFIPNHHFEEFPKEYQDAITNHNSELDQFDFNTPKQLEIFIIKDGVLIGIQFNNYFLEENNIPSAEGKTYEINYRFQFKDNSEKKDKEKELREIIFKDPEFKYCKNQESRYWYLLELLEQDGMEEYRYLAEDPGVYFNGKVKMFMDKTWTIYKEIKNKK